MAGGIDVLMEEGAEGAARQELLEGEGADDRKEHEPHEAGEGMEMDPWGDEDEMVDELRMLRSESQGDGCADGVSDEMAASDAQRGDDIGHGFGAGLEGEREACGRGLFALAEAREVDGDDVEGLSEGREDVVEREAGGEDSVEEKDRGAGADLVDTDADTACGDVTRDEIGWHDREDNKRERGMYAGGMECGRASG
jgi:hypothetical protein